MEDGEEAEGRMEDGEEAVAQVSEQVGASSSSAALMCERRRSGSLQMSWRGAGRWRAATADADQRSHAPEPARRHKRLLRQPKDMTERIR